MFAVWSTSLTCPVLLLPFNMPTITYVENTHTHIETSSNIPLSKGAVWLSYTCHLFVNFKFTDITRLTILLQLKKTQVIFIVFIFVRVTLKNEM